jgi:hypothetical protein
MVEGPDESDVASRDANPLKHKKQKVTGDTVIRFCEIEKHDIVVVPRTIAGEVAERVVVGGARGRQVLPITRVQGRVELAVVKVDVKINHLPLDEANLSGVNDGMAARL